jgi:hypothetical protein
VTKAQYEVFEARRRRRLPANAVKTSASVGKTQVAPRACFALLSQRTILFVREILEVEMKIGVSGGIQ